MNIFQQRLAAVFAGTLSAFNCCPTSAWEDSSADRPLIGAGAAFVGVHCGNQPGNPKTGDCYEVFAETLKTIPLVFEIGLGTTEKGPKAVLWTNQHRWSDFLEIVQAEGDAEKALRFDIVKSSERFSFDEVVGKDASVIRSVEEIPRTTRQGRNGVSVLALVTDADGDPLKPGVYRFSGRVRPGATAFLGAAVWFNVDFGINIRSDDEANREELDEQLIERHYLWGTALRQRGIIEGDEVLKRGFELVKAYIDRGAGDGDEVYNLTPRYQAARLLKRMDQKREAIAYLQRAYSQGVAAKECRWRPYLFGPDSNGNHRGPMPQRVKDVIYRVLQRLYMEEYGRSLHGIPEPGDTRR
jgi:hypothetical protein